MQSGWCPEPMKPLMGRGLAKRCSWRCGPFFLGYAQYIIVVICTNLRTNSTWHVDLLIGNSHETSNKFVRDDGYLPPIFERKTSVGMLLFSKIEVKNLPQTSKEFYLGLGLCSKFHHSTNPGQLREQRRIY